MKKRQKQKILSLSSLARVTTRGFLWLLVFVIELRQELFYYKNFIKGTNTLLIERKRPACVSQSREQQQQTQSNGRIIKRGMNNYFHIAPLMMMMYGCWGKCEREKEREWELEEFSWFYGFDTMRRNITHQLNRFIDVKFKISMHNIAQENNSRSRNKNILNRQLSYNL